MAGHGSPRRRRFPLVPAVAVAVIGVDQFAKVAVVETLGSGAGARRVDLVGSWLALHYVENTGAAFGLLREQGLALSLAALVVLGGVVAYYRRAGATSALAAASVGLLVGGAVGNLIDRARLGYVVDFVAVGPWPKFNVADSAITVGVLLLGWHAVAGGAATASTRPPPRATRATAHPR